MKRSLALLALVFGTLALQGQRADPLAIPEITRDKVICFALYTVHDRVLKMTAQLYELQDDEPRDVRLEVDRGNGWQEIARSVVDEDGWAATFRVPDWDDTTDASYRLLHSTSASYTGLIRRNPVAKDVIVIAGFTGNSINKRHGGDISRQDIIANVKKLDPDVLFFSGDQVYDHKRHFAAWLKFGRDFGEIIRDRPTITIPDDHDVGQANLWGESGKKSNTGAGNDGGYFRDPAYVRMVERAQTSHLPDPYDATPVQRGIGVYYTKYLWGGISFAIIEDRKFKTGPKGRIPKQGPRPDHILNPDYDPKSVDVADAILLGERQLAFLDDWGQDWRDAKMKVALSQTIFCGGAHIHGKIGGRLHADLDSNGWPQTGRNKAIDALRKCYAVHFAGDQHLATIFQHGVDEWRDGCFSFCVPSIANLYLRWWEPLEPGQNREPGMHPFLGDHLDGLGNHVTCWAVANPEPGSSGGLLTTRAAGFGVMALDKRDRTITMSCWPRNVDVEDPEARQYPGWPKTIAQTDNYGRKATGYLPTIQIDGPPDQVVQVIEEASGEWIYTLRIKGNEFRPKVFAPGRYTIKVGEGDQLQVYEGIEAGPLDDTRTLTYGVEGEVGARIDAYLSSVEPFGFAGVVLVEQDGDVILRKGYGLADRTRKLPNSVDTRFDLGSLSKQFTAALIMRLAEKRILALDAPLSSLLPDVPPDKAWITPAHLLSHSSGLPYHATIGHSMKGQSLVDLVPIYLAQPLQFEPGAQFSYSNPGYTLLAAIAERATGTPFPGLIHAYITEPAGLSATGHLARAIDIGGPWARAYLDELDVGAPPEWPPDPEGAGAGGVVSTVDDLHRWLETLRAGRLLEPASVEEMWRNQISIGETAGYGFGWFVAKTPRDTSVVFHAGDYQGFNNELRLYRDEARLIILLSNVRLAGTGVREVAMHNIATIAAGGDAELAPTVIDADAGQHAQRMGAYATEGGGRFELSAGPDGVRVESLDASVISWMTTAEAPDAPDSTWEERVEAMMKAAAVGDFEPVRQARHRAVVVRGGPTELQRLVALLAPDATDVLRWEIIGSFRAGPAGSGQTFVRLRAGERETLVRYVWMDDALLAIGESDGPQLDMRPVGPHEFAWFDLFTGRSVRLRFDGETVHLEGVTTLTASKVPTPG